MCHCLADKQKNNLLVMLRLYVTGFFVVAVVIAVPASLSPFDFYCYCFVSFVCFVRLFVYVPLLSVHSIFPSDGAIRPVSVGLRSELAL